MKMSNSQRTVVRTIRQGPQDEALGERETLQDHAQKNVAPETPRTISSAIGSWDPASDFSVPGARDVESVLELTPTMDDESSIPTAELELPTVKREREREGATPLLGQNSWVRIPRSSGHAFARAFLKALKFTFGQALNPYGPSSWRMLCTS